MKKVSVIIPVYNVEKYLRECVESVLAQTYENIEVILVDDGSPDGCPAICDEYAARDERVRVIHQENRGVAVARNAGLEIASGEYLAFADPDDVCSPVMYEALVTALEEENADMAMCEYARDLSRLDKSDAPRSKRHLFSSYDDLISVLTNAPNIRDITWSGIYVWDKLYKRELVIHKFNSEYLMSEDNDFNRHYIRACKKAVVIPRAFYLYRENEDSILGKYNGSKLENSSIIKGISNASAWLDIMNDAEERAKSESVREYLRARAAYTAHGMLWRAYAAHLESEHEDFVCDSRRLIKEHSSCIFRDKATYSLFIRTMCALCSHAFAIWKLAARLYGVVRMRGRR